MDVYEWTEGSGSFSLSLTHIDHSYTAHNNTSDLRVKISKNVFPPSLKSFHLCESTKILINY